jgi:hypothetical protein
MLISQTNRGPKGGFGKAGKRTPITDEAAGAPLFFVEDNARSLGFLRRKS